MQYHIKLLIVFAIFFRGGPERMLVIENPLPALTRQQNADDAREKDREERQKKQAEWEVVERTGVEPGAPRTTPIRKA